MEKTVNKLKKDFSKIDWYKQGGAMKPFYGGYPWRTCYAFTLFGKKIPIFYKNTVCYEYDNVFFPFFDKKTMRRVANFYYSRQIKNKNFIQNFKIHWDQQARDFKKIVEELYLENFSDYSDKKLLQLFSDFTRVYNKLWSECIFLDAFDATGDEILNKARKKQNKPILDDELHLLTSPETYSWLQKEKFDLLTLCSQYKQNKILFQQKLNEHTLRYNWILNDYAIVKHLDEKYFFRQIKELLKNKNKYLREKKNLSLVAKTAAVKKKLYKKLNLSAEFKNTLRFLVALAQWRDDRKAHNQMASGILKKFSQEFSQRLDISLNTIEHLFWWEAIRIFKSKNQQKFIQISKEREKGILYFDNPSKNNSFYFGSKARILFNYLNNLVIKGKKLTGRTAFPGMVRGRAKIILTQDDFYKLKPGDILIAPNTRPEYVPIMKLAGAIISEEGGLTSHTAIVSRELKIPAIVGMQGVLTALNDGDLIEVDAGHGLIKKLKLK